MKQDKWTQQLRDKLAEHEVAPPEGLWEEIAPLCPPCRGKSRFVALRRWAAAAAAVVALAILWWEAPLSPPRRGMSEAQQSPSLGEGKGVGPETISESTQAPKKLLAEETQKIQTPPLTPPLEGRGRGETPAEPTTAEITDSHTERPDTVEAETTDEPSNTSEAVVRDMDRQIAEIKNTKSGPLTLGLYAMNGFSGQSSSNGVLMAEEMAMKYREVYEYSYATSARSTEPIYLTGYEERQHHHRPVSFGLTLSYPLTERLSLTTGLVYTKLSSDFTQVMNKMQIRREQTLHYVGVPLGLSYRLWALKGFRAYASAGALTYLNVATRVVTEGVTQEMEKDRAQLSLNGSLGLQYDVIPQIGLYVEPGLSYYPDNRSHIQNFFKDKPVNLSLQVGLRVNIK
jgi:hypothetical protein